MGAPSIRLPRARAVVVTPKPRPGSFEEFVERKIEAEAAGREQERGEQYVVALRRERMGLEVELDRLRRLRPDSRERQQWELEVSEPPTAAARIVGGERRIAAIDAELERVSG